MLTSPPSLDYASSLSSSIAPSSPSTTSPRLHSVLSLSATTSTKSEKSRTRRSLSLFGKLPSEFSTILHSHNTSRRSSSLAQPPKALLSDYAQVTEMYNSPDDERPTRKTKSQNRFYSFLTRSRSRSRSKSATTEEIEGAIPELALNSNQDPHSRNSSWSSRGRDRHKPMFSTSFKPSNIIQSRPLSSTTTATNTTVTPPTPKARRHVSSSVPVPSSSFQPGPSQENNRPPASPKNPSTTRRRLNNIFGFSSSRKSSLSSSRGTSPGHSSTSVQSNDVPPVPHPYNPNSRFDIQGNDHEPPSQLPRSYTSPSPLGRCEQSPEPLISSLSTSAYNASKLDNFFKPTKLFSSSSSRRRAQSPPNISLPYESISTPLPTPSSSGSSNPPPSPITVSGPTKVSSSSRASRRRGSTSGGTAESHSTSSSSAHRPTHVHAPQPRSVAALSQGSDGSTVIGMIPRITQTPPTPARSGTAPPRMSQRKDSMDSGYRYRPLVIVDEERERESLDKGKGRDINMSSSTGVGSSITRNASKGKESDYSAASGSRSNHRHGRYSTGMKPPSKTVIRATKHGSFDFERPVWGTGSLMTRTASGASASTGYTGRYSKSGESVASTSGGGNKLDKEKDRPRESTSKKTEQKSSKPSSADTRTQQSREQRSPPSSSRPLRPDTHDEPAPPYPTGERLSSSLGRNTGKRVMGSGIARLVGITHGPFSFEPPVPSPTFSHTSNGGTASETEVRKSEKDKGNRKRGKDTGQPIGRDPKKTERSHVSSSNRPVMGGARPGNRGRSLDLGLGLSWAPSKVREDILFPAGTFVNGWNHSHSASSRNGLARTTDTVAEERSKVGKEIADVFKNTLDEEGYATFKKYVLQFDAHEIPFEGPRGIIDQAARLLDKRSNLGKEAKERLLDKLVRIILQNA